VDASSTILAASIARGLGVDLEPTLVEDKWRIAADATRRSGVMLRRASASRIALANFCASVVRSFMTMHGQFGSIA
jgi:hypothetical protein